MCLQCLASSPTSPILLICAPGMLSALLWPDDLAPIIPEAFALLVFESHLEKPTNNIPLSDAASHKSS